jgi:hypothetical protein
VGIRKDRVARAWQRLAVWTGLCDASWFAFLRGWSAIQLAMTKGLLLERATKSKALSTKHHGLPMADGSNGRWQRRRSTGCWVICDL